MSQYFYLFATLVAYFYFNWSYFFWVTAALGQSRLGKPALWGSFLFNYVAFCVCSWLELNLIVNWTVFFLILFAETLVLCKKQTRPAVLFSLTGILCGLSINIFCRCAVSIAIAQPLAVFDNHTLAPGNLKGLPVLLGFLLSGMLLHFLTGSFCLRQARTLLTHPQHLAFLLEVMCGMFLYLFLNLLIYQSRENGIMLKLWGIKSCVFSIVGTFLGVRYSLEMCELSDYREKNRMIRTELIEKTREEADLRTVAYRDVLTGAYSRQYALDTIARLQGQREPFALGFVDLDRLKEVNDQHGHAQGDCYLMTAAQALESVCRRGQDLLCRYGGDEFLLVMHGASVEIAERRLHMANERLREASKDGGFSMSISWGVAQSGAGQDVEGLIRAADEKMYCKKRAHSAKEPQP